MTVCDHGKREKNAATGSNVDRKSERYKDDHRVNGDSRHVPLPRVQKKENETRDRHDVKEKHVVATKTTGFDLLNFCFVLCVTHWATVLVTGHRLYDFHHARAVCKHVAALAESHERWVRLAAQEALMIHVL